MRPRVAPSAKRRAISRRRQQVGDVGAHDQQYECHGRHHHRDHGADVVCGHLAIVDDPQRRPLVRLGVLARQIGPDRGHLGVGLGEGDARLQATHDVQVALVARVLAGLEVGGDEEVRGLGEAELGRRHADDLAHPAVHLDRAADHLGIGFEALLPDAMAHHDHGECATLLLLFGNELAPQNRGRAVDREQPGRHPGRVETLRLLAEGHIGLGLGVARDALEGLGPLPHVDQVREAQLELLLVMLGVDAHDQSVAVEIHVGPRPEHERVRDVEDHGVGADPEPHDQDHDAGKRRGSPQRAPADLEVLPQRAHYSPSRSSTTRPSNRWIERCA